MAEGPNTEPLVFQSLPADRGPEEPASDDVHIASYIVQVRPEARAALLAFISSNPALECCAGGEEGVEEAQGKLVLVAEAPDQGRILDDMDALEQQPGVLACTLVYHEVMTSREADHELIAADSRSQLDSAILTGIQP